MTNGPAPRADDPPSGSSTPPIDGPPSEPSTTEPLISPNVFPISAENLSDLLRDTFQNGWESARTLPHRERLEVTFNVKIDRATESVSVTVVAIP